MSPAGILYIWGTPPPRSSSQASNIAMGDVPEYDVLLVGAGFGSVVTFTRSVFFALTLW